MPETTKPVAPVADAKRGRYMGVSADESARLADASLVGNLHNLKASGFQIYGERRFPDGAYHRGGEVANVDPYGEVFSEPETCALARRLVASYCYCTGVDIDTLETLVRLQEAKTAHEQSIECAIGEIMERIAPSSAPKSEEDALPCPTP